jgi:hypothetical protein
MAGSSPPGASDVKRGTLCTLRSDDPRNQISVKSDSWLGHQGAKTPELDRISSRLLSWVHGLQRSKFGWVSRARFVSTPAIDLKLCTYSVTVQSGSAVCHIPRDV